MFNIDPQTLAPMFVVKNPEYLPTQARSLDAGHDVKAYLKEPLSEVSLESIKKVLYPIQADHEALFIDGKPAHQPGEMQSIDKYELLCEQIKDLQGAIYVQPGETHLVPLGFKVALPVLPNSLFNLQMKLFPRSGLASKHNLILANTVGIIDAGYRDEVVAALHNTGRSHHIITDKCRVGQVTFEFCLSLEGFSKSLIVKDFPKEIQALNRGGGFGSTGV